MPENLINSALQYLLHWKNSMTNLSLALKSMVVHGAQFERGCGREKSAILAI
jgi:hypothetical protein